MIWFQNQFVSFMHKQFVFVLQFGVVTTSRVQLEEAQAALATTKNELNETKEELFVTQTSLRNSDMQLRDTEKRLSLLSQNR